MNWVISDRADPPAVALADRHYSRQKPGTPQFVPPGSCLVLLTEAADALWVSARPFAQFVRHAWAGAWTNPVFRNEGPVLSSQLITEAVAATLGVWGGAPPLGMVTFVDAKKVRHKRDPGRVYRKAGWRHVGFTKGGLWAFQLVPAAMPRAERPLGLPMPLFEVA